MIYFSLGYWDWEGGRVVPPSSASCSGPGGLEGTGLVWTGGGEDGGENWDLRSRHQIDNHWEISVRSCQTSSQPSGLSPHLTSLTSTHWKIRTSLKNKLSKYRLPPRQEEFDYFSGNISVLCLSVLWDSRAPPPIIDVVQVAPLIQQWCIGSRSVSPISALHSI